jgi:hypothetical protein
VKFPKSPRYKNEAYRRFVAGFPCFACGIEGWSQCAHANGGGMGTKRSDLETFPLCTTRPGHQGCHTLHDLCVEMTRAERREIEAQYIDRMQAIARREGRSEFKEAA